MANVSKYMHLTWNFNDSVEGGDQDVLLNSSAWEVNMDKSWVNWTCESD